MNRYLAIQNQNPKKHIWYWHCESQPREEIESYESEKQNCRNTYWLSNL